MQRARTSPPPIPLHARKEGSGVRRRPALPPPKAKLPPRKPVIVEAPEEEDTVVEDIDDPFEALLRSPPPAPNAGPVQARARDTAHRAADVVSGALACFAAHRDARVLSALSIAATLAIVLPLALVLVLAAAYRPEPTLVKETRPKPAPHTVVVPWIVPIVVREEPPPAPERAHPRRARQHRHR